MSLESRHKKFIAGLKSYISYTPKQEAERNAFSVWREEKRRKGEKPLVVEAALGMVPAYAKEVIRPESGGVEIEFWGVSYRLKLNPQGEKLKTLDIAKATIFRLPLLAMRHLPVLIGICFSVINRKKCIRTLDEILQVAIDRSVRVSAIEIIEYNPVSRELHRATQAILAHGHGPYQRILENASLFVELFLELDIPYRFAFQDAFAPLTERGIDRFWKAFQIFASRWTHQPIKAKLKKLKLLLKLLLRIFPQFKRFIAAVIDEIDWQNIVMDDADRYYSLGYEPYDFHGMSIEERLKIRKQIDREREHIVFWAQ